MAARLGELLVRENLISLQQLQQAQEAQKREGGRLGYHLTKVGAIQETELAGFLAKQHGVSAIDLKGITISEEVLKIVPKEVCEKHGIVPVNRSATGLVIAMSDPSNVFAIDDIKFLTGFNIEVVVASEEAIKEAIDRYYNKKEESSSELGTVTYEEVLEDFDPDDIRLSDEDDDEEGVSLEKDVDTAPVIRLVNLILIDAIQKGCSDIHVEPYEKEFRVRFRIDGALYEVMRPPMALRNAITSRLKIMSSLDIAEKRLPQDGRIKLKLGKGREMDYRVSVCPTLFGEKVVLRLLDKSNLQLDMTKLGFEPGPLKIFKNCIHRPYGMVLVTGPTGSGKTTTLYSALGELNKVSDNISTAEDPVEFNFAGINQVQMHDSIGLNFSAALRSFLRQDPDIIMVGEIRDFETGEIAVKAALTGHLVLSTLHTNDAPSTISRMLNMGIEPFLVTASVNCIIAQRLGRRLCRECIEQVPIDEQALLDIGVDPDQIGTFDIFESKGCPTCNNTGCKGRIALYEVMEMYEPLKELVINGASAAELKTEAIRLGMQTLRMAAINKLKEGIISMKEVVKNTAPD